MFSHHTIFKDRGTLAVVLSVVLSVFFVVAIVEAATTISTSITTGSSVTAVNFVASGATATSTFAGGLTIDSTDLIVDPDGAIVSVGGSLGVASTSPGVPLEVLGDVRFGEGNLFNGFFFDATTGQLGIQDGTPTYTFDVSGLGRFTGLVDASHFIATSSTATSTFAGGVTVDTSDFVVDPDGGLIGIGTTTPSQKLHVSSGASATTTVRFGATASAASKTGIELFLSDGSLVCLYATSTGATGNGIVIESGACN